MNASTLRAGNLIYKLGETKEIFIVSAYNLRLVGAREYQYEYIPLTEDWLLRAGFEKKRNGMEMTVGALTLMWDGKSIKVAHFSDQVLTIFDEPELVFVHDLQNWYYYNTNKTELEFLTGQEIQFK